MKKGFLQVYTGNGKGKTTAAFGQAFRAYGRGFKVGVVQFMKSWITGEVLLAEKLENFELIRIDTSTKFTWEMTPEELENLKQTVRKGFFELPKLIADNKFDLLVIDEFNHLLVQNFITKEEVLSFLDGKPETMELVLTGRNAPDWLIERADLVTEMKPLKHYFDKGVEARKGIEN